MAISESMWLLRVLRACYGVYVLLLFAKIALREGVTGVDVRDVIFMNSAFHVGVKRKKSTLRSELQPWSYYYCSSMPQIPTKQFVYDYVTIAASGKNRKSLK